MLTKLGRTVPKSVLIFGLLSMAGVAARWMPQLADPMASAAYFGGSTVRRNPNHAIFGPVGSAQEVTVLELIASQTGLAGAALADGSLWNLGRRLNPIQGGRTSLVTAIDDSDRSLQPTTTPAATQAGTVAETAAPESEGGADEPFSQRSPTAVVLATLARGAGLAAASLILFGVYRALRPRIRALLGRLRTPAEHGERRRRGEDRRQ